MKTVLHAQNRLPLRNNAKKLREKEKEWEKVARCILVHYSNCPTGTQQCVAMHCHCCSKVFKKRDPAINPMNMGFLGPLGDARHVPIPSTSACASNNADIAHFSPLSRARMMRRASAFCRQNDRILTPRWSRGCARIYACSIILSWSILSAFEVNEKCGKCISRQHIFRSFEYNYYKCCFLTELNIRRPSFEIPLLIRSIIYAPILFIPINFIKNNRQKSA